MNYFFEAYFHQDWAYDYTTAFDAIKDFVSKESIEIKKSFEKALIKVLEDDQISENFIHEHGGNYDPKYDGVNIRDWLKQILDFLRLNLD